MWWEGRVTEARCGGRGQEGRVTLKLGVHNLQSVLPGNALITVATGDLSAEDKERSGLVTLHAYAVLEVKEVLVRSCDRLVVVM